VDNRQETLNTEHVQWKNMASILLSRKLGYQRLLTDDTIRIRLQFFCIYIIFSFVSAGMTVVNIFTGFRLLMYSTLIFGIANIINVVLCLICEFTEKLTRYLFSTEIVLMFTWFAIMGEPEGFSVIWVVLLPTCGLLLYRLKYGALVSMIQCLILIFLFWTPWGRALLQYPYTASFMLRFPMLYLAFFSLGVFFEFVRHTTQTELVTARKEFEYLYNHDALTGLYNRYGFNLNINALTGKENTDGFAFAIFDLDHFKNINDTYGHMNGDVVLKTVGTGVSRMVGENGIVSRWGGEEFAILFHDPDQAIRICQDIIRWRRESDIKLDGQSCSITISAGLLLVPAGKQLATSEIITMADANLYDAKESGRNRMIVSSL